MVQLLKSKKVSIAVSESCTGGMLAEAITSVSGASNVFELSITAYSERIKINELGVLESTLTKKTVYSKEVALQMADGVRKKASSIIGVGITGVAGPYDISENLPMGSVFIAVVYKDANVEKNICEHIKLNELYYDLSREKVRKLAVLYALDFVKEILL